MAPGSAYSYQLYTHCGVIWAYFDGRWWKADPVLVQDGNPPPGWGNPFDRGVMRLLSSNEARFTSASGQTAASRALGAEVQNYPGEPCW